MSMSVCDMPEGNAEPLLLTVEELAQLLSLSERTLWRLRSAGALPKPVKLGNSVRWVRVEIQNWIEAGCPSPKARENGRVRR